MSLWMTVTYKFLPRRPGLSGLPMKLGKRWVHGPDGRWCRFTLIAWNRRSRRNTPGGVTAAIW